MTEEEYMQLKQDILQMMVMEVKEGNAEKDGEPSEDEQTRKNGSARGSAPAAYWQTDTDNILWGNMARVHTVIKTRDGVDDDTIALDCAREMKDTS